MCNVLKNEPNLIAEFLQEYFTMANKIIHKHNRILDKFIGAGIMTYFGYKDSDDGIEGAFKSINAAFKLQKNLLKKSDQNGLKYGKSNFGMK
jgi:class 3 adenylate cyclase